MHCRNGYSIPQTYNIRIQAGIIIIDNNYNYNVNINFTETKINTLTTFLCVLELVRGV